MPAWKTAATRVILDGLYYSAAYRLLEPACSGVGVIFMLHRVRDARPAPFSPNRILQVTPAFLDQTLHLVRARGYDIISLDEARERLLAGAFDTRFACFTLDDGYADNVSDALPVFARHRAPFTVYVTSGLPDGVAVLWWQHLEEIIARGDRLSLELAGRERHFRTRTTAQKYRAFESIYRTLRALPHAERQAALAALLARHGIDTAAACRREAMTWESIATLAREGLATIGAHTLSHHSLAGLSAAEARREIEDGRQRIAERTGLTPTHFAYPFGDRGSAARREFDIARELGFATATTTRKGVLFPAHAAHLHALPRVSLNGDYQAQRYARLFLGGTPFALARRFRRLDVD